MDRSLRTPTAPNWPTGKRPDPISHAYSWAGFPHPPIRDLYTTAALVEATQDMRNVQSMQQTNIAVNNSIKEPLSEFQAKHAAVTSSSANCSSFKFNRLTKTWMPDPASRTYVCEFRSTYYPGSRSGELYATPDEAYIHKPAYAVSYRHIPQPALVHYGVRDLAENMKQRNADHEVKIEDQDDNQNRVHAPDGNSCSYRRTMRLGYGEDEEYDRAGVDALLASVHTVRLEESMTVKKEEDRDDVHDRVSK